MFQDPIIVSVTDKDDPTATINESFVRLPSKPNEGLYRMRDKSHALIVKQRDSRNRVRSELRLTQDKYSSDLHDTTQNTKIGCSVYVVIDAPKNGFSDDEKRALISSLVNLISGDNTDADANLTKLIGGEI